MELPKIYVRQQIHVEDGALQQLCDQDGALQQLFLLHDVKIHHQQLLDCSFCSTPL